MNPRERMAVRVLTAAVVGCVAGTAHGAEVAWQSETVGEPHAIAAILEAQRLDAKAPIDRAGVEAELRHVGQSLEVPRRMVVSFTGALDGAQRAALAERGVRVLSWLGGGSYFATIDPGSLDAAGASEIGGMTGVQEIRAEWKSHSMIVQGSIPEYALLTHDDDPMVATYVVFHKDVPMLDARAVAMQHNAQVRDELESINGLVVELRESQLAALIADDMVQWVEPPLPRMSENNAENRVITQVNTVNGAPYGLDGSGVTVMIYDGGTALTTHTDFSGRASIRDGSGTNDHATHVAGTVGGDGSTNANHRGMAPGVTINSYGFQYDGSGIFLYTNPGDIETDYQSGFVNFGSMVSNNSIGTNVEPNGFPCSLQGDYGVTSAVIDEVVRGSVGTPAIVVWAAGNERQGSGCDIEGFGDYYSSAPPSLAKNSIGVGALNANDDSMTSFSSWGPADDGRLKPDIAAPGCQSSGDFGVTSLSSAGNTSYTVKCGTSMASPTVTGIVALLLEDWQAQYPASDLPMNSTVKAMLIQTALDRGNAGPDYQFGYGSVRAQALIDLLRTGNFVEDSIEDGAALTVLIDVEPGDPEFKLTLAWDDPAGAPNVSPALVNDLDLVVIDPLGNRHYPWNLDPGNPSAPAVRTGEDHLNNVEQVYVANPLAGRWEIEVRATDVPEGPQAFSLAASQSPLVTGISMTVVGAIPGYVAPGDAFDLSVNIEAIDQSLVGDPLYFWRYDAGAFQSAELIPQGGTEYLAVFPAPDCGDTIEIYFSAVGDLTGEHLLPAAAPGNAISPIVGESIEPVAYDFEVASGWVVDPDGTDTATTGAWNRMDPEVTAAQPGNDVTPDPGSICWVTDGFAGASLGVFDVDAGTTTLASPVMDLSALSTATMSYWRWYSNNTGADPGADVFVIDVSDDAGASWTNVETIGPVGAGTTGGWIYHEFQVEDYVALTSQVRIRFIAEDADLGSIVEAAIDELRVTSDQCIAVPPSCAGDLDADQDVDVLDFGIFSGNFGAGPGATPSQGDLTGDGFIDVFDFSVFAGNFGNHCD